MLMLADDVDVADAIEVLPLSRPPLLRSRCARDTTRCGIGIQSRNLMLPPLRYLLISEGMEAR